MGQYYSVILKDKGKVLYSMRKVKDAGYIMAKLMEHSYSGVFIIDSVASHLYKNKCRLIWCGDYASPDEITTVSNGEAKYEKAWGNKAEEKSYVFDKVEFKYDGKFFVNHSKKVYISFDDFAEKHGDLSPISLLTAIGNGRGGGDYGGKGEKKIGTWAWDEISIEDEKPKGYKKFAVQFEES